VKTGDVKVDDVLAQIEAGRIRVSDRVRTEIDELAGALDQVPDSHPDRPDTLAALRSILDEVTSRHTAMVDPFIEDERNEKFQVEDGQGNLITVERDARGHTRETVTMTRTELAERRARQRWADDELAAIKDLHGQADDFSKAAAAGMGDVQSQALKARAEELRTEARTRKQAVRDAGVKLRPTVEEVMRERKVATGEVASVLEAFRSGRFQEAVDGAKALNRTQLHELNAQHTGIEARSESSRGLPYSARRLQTDSIRCRTATNGDGDSDREQDLGSGGTNTPAATTSFSGCRTGCWW